MKFVEAGGFNYNGRDRCLNTTSKTIFEPYFREESAEAADAAADAAAGSG